VWLLFLCSPSLSTAAEKAEKTEKIDKEELELCKQQFSADHHDCAEEVKEKMKTCMIKAKIIFNRAERMSGTTQCKRQSNAGLFLCKEVYAECYKDKE
jgi:hypothetical protein